jgi:subfamily B ATP-binding cassette protein MsbA
VTTPIEPAARRRLPSPKQLARLWPRVRPHRKALTLASLALLLSAAIGLAFPLVVGRLLDAAFVDQDRSLLDRVALGLTGLFVIQAFLNYAQTYLLSATGERAVAGLREELFAKLLDMSPGFFADRKTGELTSRLTIDIGLLQGVLSNQIAEFARQILALVGGIVLLTWIQPQLTLTALAVVPVAVGTALFFGRRLRRISTAVQDRVAGATAVAEEAFSQIRTVQSFVQEPVERARYGGLIGGVVEAALIRARVRGVFFGAITFSTFTGIVIVLWQGGRLVLDGSLTAGTLVSFLLLTVTIAASVGALASFFGNYQESVGAAERVFQLLESDTPISDPPNPTPLPSPIQGWVEFDRVSFRYLDHPDAPWAVREVSLRLAPGEVVAIVGPSGAGKTTLISLLPRFWDVAEGSIRLEGIDVRQLRLRELRGAIGVVPQEPALFSGTVRENIAYARPDASEADVERAARAAHAHEFVERLPGGYDTIVGERGVKLSGGQRQRIAIARAVLKDPAVLVLDEATSSLDTESERLVEDALEKLLVGRTTLIIAHRLSTVRRADRLVVLDHGRVVEEGSHADLLARGGLYARLYQRQFRNGDAELEGVAAG